MLLRFLSAANKLLATKDEIIANGHEMAELLFDTSELETEQATLLEETQLISDMVQQSIYENVHVALDQAEYQKCYDSLTHQFDTAKERLETVMAQLQQMQLQRADIEAFLRPLRNCRTRSLSSALKTGMRWWITPPSTAPTISASPSSTVRK